MSTLREDQERLNSALRELRAQIWIALEPPIAATHRALTRLLKR